MWDAFLQVRDQGFLGTRGTLMLDVVAVAMLAVLPILSVSIWAVKYRRNYPLHYTLQVILGIVLLFTVLVFEIDVRVFGWKHKAEPSPYYHTWLFPVFYVHLAVAVTTTVMWYVVTIAAWLKFPRPPAPGAHSAFHLRWSKVAAVGMFLTAITGWLFYYLAFVAA